jgi:hypothetical protein
VLARSIMPETIWQLSHTSLRNVSAAALVSLRNDGTRVYM